MQAGPDLTTSEVFHPLIVIGHRNPDTDSICSAIAYAHLKNTVLNEPARAYRAGSVNEQTSFVLERFRTPCPPLLTDVYPRIADIMIKGVHLITLQENDPLSLAQDIMLENRFSFLPVVDPGGRCTGKITAIRLAGLTRELAELARPRRVSVDLENFAARVQAHSLTQCPLPGRFSGTLIVGRASDHALEGPDPVLFLAPADEGVALRALKRGVKIMAWCSPDRVSEKVQQEAVRQDACLLSLPDGLLGAAVHLLLSMPVREFVEREHLTFRHDDLLRHVQKEIGKYNEGGFIVLDADGFIKGVITRLNFLNQGRFRVVMVDHNEPSQGVDGLEEADVVEVIDHHRLGARSTDSPITFINKVVGSTATMVAEAYRNHNAVPDKNTAGLLLSAVLSDTVILKSPTTTPLDHQMAAWLASLARVDVAAYGDEMFAAGCSLQGIDPRGIVTRDQKLYSEGEWKFSVSQIEVVGFDGFFQIRAALYEELTALIERKELAFSCLMVTDITEGSSLLLCAGSDKLIETVTYPLVEKNVYEMKSVLSRKKQVLPYLLDLMREI